MTNQFHFRQQKSGALLELAVLGGVDERVDEAVAVHQNASEVVVPASKVGSAIADGDNGQVHNWSVAETESAAHHQ